MSLTIARRIGVALTIEYNTLPLFTQSAYDPLEDKDPTPLYNGNILLISS